MKLKWCIAAMVAAAATFSPLGSSTAQAQEVAVKTNLLSDALLNISGAAEFGLAPKWTLELGGSYNGWTLSHNRRWKHWAAQPELRYWLCERFGGHFFGVHAHGGQFNIGGIDTDFKLLGTDFGKLADARYQGWFIGGGLAYGYAWQFSRHWGMEAEIGVGYSYTRFDQFRCSGCQRKTHEDLDHHYLGVTRAAINLVYGF